MAHQITDPLIDLATVPPLPLHPAAQAARAPLAGVVADLLAIPDDALERRWEWRPSEFDEGDVRYGLYRIHEGLEAATGAIATGHVTDGMSAETAGPAVSALRAMGLARWELHGVLTPLSAADWDADPGGGEWSVRATLGHIIGGQRSYGWYNAWYLRQPQIEGETLYPADGTMPSDVPEEEEAAGTPTAVMARLDEVVDANIAASGHLDVGALRVGARWMGIQVNVGFRLGRYGSHIREHTVQVDKTLAMIGRQPTEVERVLRLILGSYGRLESLFVGRTADEMARPFSDGQTPVAILDAAMADAVATAAEVRAAALG
ncbi:MAG: DinB family protein [Chloroflexota bacterium]